ncbi:8043_t:CDS:1, partial [Dentiscutata erythropus]
EIDKLLTRIYKEYKLLNEIRQYILQTFLRNTLIKFMPPSINKELAK